MYHAEKIAVEAMTASYAGKHSDAVEGLILFAADFTTSATILTGMDRSGLTVYGAKDGVLNREKYEE